MKVAVASGKGGTGKTTVAVSLALALEEKIPVQFLDCDVEEPNGHLFLNPTYTQKEEVTLLVPEVDENKCNYCGTCAKICAFNAIAIASQRVLVFPELCHGCGACSRFCPRGAIKEIPFRIGIVASGWAGRIEMVEGRLDIGKPLAPPVIKAVKKRARPNKAVIIDAPPGTSCPVVTAISGSDFCLLVTEPTPFGLYDLKLAIEVSRELRIPCGVIINRSTFTDGEVERYCYQEDVPVVLKIPFDQRYAACYAKGVPFILGFPEWAPVFRDLWQRIDGMVKKGV
ncbi:MinD superfamily P-loop ATPase, contains an inserted ferredoxin domain [Thermanaeromonas toyohensis ToBE]|uniref:MinD superfamily P-loop ATPase, contains an inserted ferredoxin domain n=1 Tax=Thermanaeromonas toyohensis ToBE TaxID=698762 RepID=A0A1W1W2L8_9FIRM|nr:ATP-binding protein [Thermanaeromonas toyohensis]SMB99641.1 MinD superfamily P-loop ATPase, contains an inserted ferredoxin domain [Thermanaeromonas toyohensis ToBE]